MTTRHLPSTPEGVALLLQDAIDDHLPGETAVDYQDPKPVSPTKWDFKFEMKVGDRIYWVTVEEGF